MNRTILTVAGVFSASSLLLVDSAIKGTALLVLAAVVAIILRRDSAATRHLVWLLAIVAMLAVPAMSAMLPQWRVLPEWASIPGTRAAVTTSPPFTARFADGAVGVMRNAEPDKVEAPSAYQPAAVLPVSPPVLVTLPDTPATVASSWNWLHALPLVWAAGFGVLILRLIAARWMLWSTERHGMVIGSSRQPAKITHDPIVAALEAATLQLGMRRPVTLLIHPEKTVPMVWGILRCRLLLPVTARQWTGEQLRSVLLHELAHIKRRDTMAQLLTQIACALYWFNPLVWFAAWRLHVERERACDDLVLASGVRPSAYAGHLLEVVTGLSPARWIQSCGLAMARKSSLEGRLAAVLGKNLNRRGVSVALAGIALAIAIGIAVPIAMLRAADEVWSPPHAAHVGGNDFSTYCAHDDKTAAYVIAYRGDFGSSSDNNSNAKTRTWNEGVKLTLKTPAGKKEVSFRRDHTVPEKLTIAGQDYDLTQGRVFLVHADGVVRQLAIEAPIVRDAKGAAELERKIAAIPPQARGDATPVKDEPKVEPKDAQSKALFESWKSSARSNGMIPGGRIGEMASSLKTYMDLNAGTEYATKCEAVLKKCDAMHDWTPAAAAALLDEIEVVAPSRAEWAMWTNIERQIHPGKPLPAELKDAPWGSPEAQGEQQDASSVALRGLRTAWLLEPRAETQPLDSVLKSRVLFHNTGKIPVCFATENWIQSGGHTAKDASGKDIKVWAVSRLGLRTRMVFRLAPGEYAEVEGHGLGVGSHETASETSIYKVGCWIEAKEGDVVTFTPAKVPVSFQTWRDNEGQKDSVTVWREMIAVRVAQESPMPVAVADRELLLRRVTKDLLGTVPTAEEIATFANDNAPDALAKLTARLQTAAGPAHFAGELSGGTTKFRVTAAVPKEDQPKQGAKLQPGTEEKLEWGESVNGLRLALAWPPTLGEPAAGAVPDFYLAVQNVSTNSVRLCTTADAPIKRRLTRMTAGVPQSRTESEEPNGTDVTLQPREVVFLRLFPKQAMQRPDQPSRGSLIAAAVRQMPKMTMLADMEIKNAPAGAWTGMLITPDTRAGIGAEAPKER